MNPKRRCSILDSTWFVFVVHLFLIASQFEAAERPANDDLPKSDEFEAELGIVQSNIKGDNPFFTLSLSNKSGRVLSFPKAWFDTDLRNVRISQRDEELGFLSLYPPPKADWSPALLLPPKSSITLVMGMPGGIMFNLESNRGLFEAKWVHHKKAICGFWVSTNGSIEFK